MSLQHVPKHQRTSKLCELATYKGKGYNAMAIQFVISKLITAKKLERFIIQTRGRYYENSIKPSWIPVRSRSFEILKELLPTQPKLLSAIKPEILEKLWVIEGYPARLVTSSGWCFNWFEHIPQGHISKYLYEYVVQNHGPTYFKNLKTIKNRGFSVWKPSMHQVAKFFHMYLKIFSIVNFVKSS